MYRIFTHLTMVAGLPTVAAAYFDPSLVDFNVSLGVNEYVQNLRDGNILVINDTREKFPVRGTLMMSTTHVDRKSEIKIGANDVFLCPTLRWSDKLHLPIVIFHESLQATHKKNYLCKIIELDKTIEAQATSDYLNPMYFSRSSLPKFMTFQLAIIRDGLYTDIDDITSAGWINRTT